MAAKDGSIEMTLSSFVHLPIRKFTIKLRSNMKAARNCGRSFVWDYFGELWCNNLCCDPRRYYCNLCLEKAKLDARPNANFEAFTIKRYQTNVSTSNYAVHLRAMHNMLDVPRVGHTKPMSSGRKRPYKKRVVLATMDAASQPPMPPPAAAVETFVHRLPQAVLGGGEGDSTAATLVISDKEPNACTDTQAEFGKDIVLWFCRDFIPLDRVNDYGFKDFVRNYNVTGDISIIPSAQQLKADLFDLYNMLVCDVRTVLAKASISGCVSVHKWANNLGHYSYTGFIYHFVTDEFHFEHVYLRVVSSLTPLSVDNMSQELHRSMHQYGLEKNKLFVIHSGGDDTINAACHHLSGESVSCVGQILNKLVVGGINQVGELRELFIKCHVIVSTLCLGTESLMTVILEKFYHDALMDLGELDEIFTMEACLYDRLTSETSSESSRDTKVDSQQLHSSHRWFVTLYVLKVMTKNRNVIDVLLEQLHNVGDVALTDSDWDALECLRDFLTLFADAVDILSSNGQNQYPTLNLVLLFRSHLLLQLESVKEDHQYVALLKNSIRTLFLDYFPVDSLAVLAALLDPRLRDLTVVNEYLANVKKEKSQFICDAIWKHAIVVSADTPGVAATILQLDMSTPSRSEIDGFTSKRPKLSITQLAKQHSGTSSEKSDAISDEISSLLTQPPESVLNDDILTFWNRKREEWPVLATLARIVFCIPATSASVSSLCQHEGLLKKARCCTFNPTNVDKVMFVSENYEYLGQSTR